MKKKIRVGMSEGVVVETVKKVMEWSPFSLFWIR